MLNTQKLPVRHLTTRGPEQTVLCSVDSVVRFDFSFSFHIIKWIKQEFKRKADLHYWISECILKICLVNLQSYLNVFNLIFPFCPCAMGLKNSNKLGPISSIFYATQTNRSRSCISDLRGFDGRGHF